MYNCCMFLFLLLVLNASVIKSEGFQRKVNIFHNPNCEKFDCEKNGISIVYVKAVSDSDVLHYVYAGGNYTETLSLILIRSNDLSSSLSINYPNLINNVNNSILDFNGKIDGAFGLVFTKLIEYNDTENKADMKSDKFLVRSFNKFNWYASIQNGSSFTFNAMSMKGHDNLLSNGKIEIKFYVSGVQKNAAEMPRLLFSGNNTQIDFILNNLNVTFSQSRFAVEFALINKLNIGAMKIDESKSVSDEHSPGVFRTENFYGQAMNEDMRYSTYLQWKPVCYLSDKQRSLTNISVAQYYPDLKPLYGDTKNILGSSLAGMFFRDIISLENTTIRLLNVSFGMIDDKYYNHTRFLIWSSMFGQGRPLIDQISIGVILVIAFGLGLPFVIVVVGSIYLIIRKRLLKMREYDTIEDPIN